MKIIFEYLDKDILEKLSGPTISPADFPLQGDFVTIDHREYTVDNRSWDYDINELRIVLKTAL